ncbi:uncharacterized protein B0H64DRAFT_134349 [Chaetomium fimeti]|uniref:Zn(2)-C6 fungal-type domain-containing protein n=1 Tax=Chaetomium fimeti TaxID=1854472 RepID=A0AAE0HK05_9PEZI|nr:hypothetical protein B0H64DRAFT_134349 [Chaetomium fimeti]
MPNARPRRLLRNSKACDFCHKRRIKCQSSESTESTESSPLNSSRCQNCADFDVRCTYLRPSKRGTVAGSLHAAAAASRQQGQEQQRQEQQRQQAVTDPSTPGNPLNLARGTTAPLIPHEPGPGVDRGKFNHAEETGSESTAEGGWTESLRPAWQSFARTATPVVRSLLSVYHETVYPIFPFFDPIRLERRLETLEHTRNRAFFCSVMAACALASARIRDGALASSQSGSEYPPAMSPEMFFAAAEKALPTNILPCRDFDCLRGYALLALASLQDAKIRAMQMYISHYFTMLAINRWHDEWNWPEGIQASEKEEWRRLYWSMYTLDVYSSIVWDGCIHYQESQARVEYPSGRSDTDTQDSNDATHWITGWNFTTDLYRILEHNLTRLRSRSSKFNLLGDVASSVSLPLTSQHRVAELYSALPPAFKQLQPATGDPARDIYGFQAANIQATMALLRMVYLSLEGGGVESVDLETKCSVVSDVLDTFHQVPKPYLRAISTPLIYHIGGIGIILGSVMEGPLSESSCRRVRDLLLSMAELLESLESFLYRSAGAGQKLRDLVVRLEEYMEDREDQRLVQSQVGTESAGPSFEDAPPPSNGWGETAMPDLSPQFQLPDEFLRDWTWPFATSNTYLSF